MVCCSGTLPAQERTPETEASLSPDDGPPPGTELKDLRYAARSFSEWATSVKSDLDLETRFTAIKALKSFGLRGFQQDAVGVIATQLHSSNTRLVGTAAAALGELGEAGVEPLRLHLEDDQAKLHSAAATALGKIGPKAKDAVAALIKTLKNADQVGRTEAARALGRIGISDDAVVAALIVATDDEFFETRRQATGALVRLKAQGEAAHDAVRKIARSSKSLFIPGVIAEVTVEEDGDVDDELVVPLLAEMLDRLDAGAGTGASSNAVVFSALSKLGPKAAPAVPKLVSLAKEAPRGYYGGRGLAVKTLGEIGLDAATVVPVIAGLLAEDNKLDGRQSGRSAPYLTGMEVNHFVEALAAYGPAAKDAIPALKELLVIRERELAQPTDRRLGESIRTQRRPSPEQIRAAIQRIEG
jgi:hypothetical protein